MLEPHDDEIEEEYWKTMQEETSIEKFAFEYDRKHSKKKHTAGDDDDDLVSGNTLATSSGIATLKEDLINKIVDAAAKKVIETMGGMLKNALDSVLEVREPKVIEVVLERITNELEKRFPAEIDRDDSWDPVGDIAQEYTEFVEKANTEQPKGAQPIPTTATMTRKTTTQQESSMVVALPTAAPRRLQGAQGQKTMRRTMNPLHLLQERYK